MSLLFNQDLKKHLAEKLVQFCGIRKLVKVLGYYKAADRAKMPFPINIVEHAYCRDPTYFYYPADIKTDSGSEGKKKRIADEKRKKKSSKKR
uniref:Uncharacterized protein n=1 Tax=Panagrolaimus davidi TaxID=227884 RepID=A0A914QQP4_9BILA